MLPTNLQNYHPPPPQPLPQGRRGVHHPPPPQSLPQGGRGGTHEAGNNWDNAAYSLQNVFQKERNLDFVHLGVCSYKAYQLACELCACVCISARRTCIPATVALSCKGCVRAIILLFQAPCFSWGQDLNHPNENKLGPSNSTGEHSALETFLGYAFASFCSSQHVPLAKQTLAASVLSWPAHCVR